MEAEPLDLEAGIAWYAARGVDIVPALRTILRQRLEAIEALDERRRTNAPLH